MLYCYVLSIIIIVHNYQCCNSVYDVYTYVIVSLYFVCRRVSEDTSFQYVWCTLPKVPYLTVPSSVEEEDSSQIEAGSNFGATVEGVRSEEEEGSACSVEEEDWQEQGSEVCWQTGHCNSVQEATMAGVSLL